MPSQRSFRTTFTRLALYFMFHNFIRVHKTPRVSPAMAAGVSETLWTMQDIAERIEARAAKLG